MNLLFFRSIIATTDREVAHLIRVFAAGNNTKVVTQLLLLQIPLGKVLELALAEAKVGWAGHSQLGAVTADGHIVGREGTGLAVDLDVIVQVLFEQSHIEDLIVHGLRAVNDKLDGGFLRFDLSR